MSCHFSEVWQIAYQKYLNSMETIETDAHTKEVEHASEQSEMRGDEQ